MRKAWLVAAAALLAAAAQAAEIEGVKLADKITLTRGGPELVLNGAGVRHRLGVMKVYVGALYLVQKSADPFTIIAEPGPKRVSMHILADEVSAQDLVSSLNTALHDNLPPAEFALIEKRVRALNAAMSSLKTLQRGAVVFLDYIPGSGTRVTVNGKEETLIAGDDFFRAMLRIWIGYKPVDGRLRDAMLGGASAFKLF